MIKQKQWKRLTLNGLFAILGICLSTLPMLCYFHLHGALEELFYAIFTFNVNYNAKWGKIINAEYSNTTLTILNIIRLTPLILLVAFTFLKRFKIKKLKDFNYFIMLSSILNIALLIETVGYAHYFTITLPLVYIFTIYTLCFDYKKAIPILLIGLFSTVRMSTIREIKEGTIFQRSMHHNLTEDMVLRNVTLDSLDQVYSYGLYYENSLYLHNNTYPVGKYIFFQKTHSQVDEKVDREINEFLGNREPTWIIARKNEENIRILDMLKNYSVVDSVDQIYLYKISDNICQ